MGNIFVRMGVVIGVLIGAQAGFLYVFHLRNPTVVQPLQPLDSFPKTVRTENSGEWVGKDQMLDKEEFNYAQLNTYISRNYTNGANRSMSVLLGTYDSAATGLYHNPFNCYDTHGFVLKSQIRKPLSAPGRPDSEVSVTTWEKENQKYVVAFWYEVADNTMFERHDLWTTQWAMRGKSKWPITFKVLIQATGDPDQATEDVLGMAKSVREWLGTIAPPT